MALTAYYDENHSPRLVPSYCLFLDFLGFSQEIKSAIQRGNENAVFRRFMDEVEPEIRRIILPSGDDETPGFPRMWDAKVFTDNTVLGYALWSGHGESEFGHALVQVMEFQLAVALKGYFVRGGWALGSLFMNENTVFGKALIDAYELESEWAVYPRIILSDEMKEIVYRHMPFHLSPPQCDHLVIDSTGTLMTHYLSEIVDGDRIEWDWLSQHADIISRRLEEYFKSKRVLEKYRWLAAYHNYFCNQLADAEGFSDAVKIRGDFPDYGIRSLRKTDSPYQFSPKKQIPSAKKKASSRKKKATSEKPKRKGRKQ